MADPLLDNVHLPDSTGMRFAKLQRWIRQVADNAGIGYTLGGLTQNIELDDSEGMRFAKLQRWMRVIADGIGGGGGGALPIRVAVPASSGAPGAVNQMAWDDSYAYFYTVGSGWRRTAIDDWS